MPNPAARSLDQVIPPEILNDHFHAAILNLARSADIKTVLEIGSSSGGGSTDAFVRGLRENPRHPRLFCMEVSEPRFNALAQRYAADPFVHCYRASSVPLLAFPTEQQVIDFYNTYPSVLRQYPIAQVLSWRDADMEYIRSESVPDDGIAKIKRENGIATFDLVLIDGSEFTGAAELGEVYGAKYILLDDVHGYKNFHNHQRLMKDPHYAHIGGDLTLRNGFAVFERRAAEGTATIDDGVMGLLRRVVREGMIVCDISDGGGRVTAEMGKLAGVMISLRPGENIQLDAYCRENNYRKIDLLRMDAGGEICRVVERAEELLKAGRADLVLFQIGAAAVERAGGDARDVFKVLSRSGYRVHTVTPAGEIGAAASCCTALFEDFVALSPQIHPPAQWFEKSAAATGQIRVEGRNRGGGYLVSFGRQP